MSAPASEFENAHPARPEAKRIRAVTAGSLPAARDVRGDGRKANFWRYRSYG